MKKSDKIKKVDVLNEKEQVNLVLTGQAIASLRESDFDTCSAVGEVIDNSLQAGAKKINLVLVEKELPNRGRRKDALTITQLLCGDDGCGMTTDILHRCLQLGFSTRYNDRSGIGRFGVGMTLAAINQCTKIEIYSKTEAAEEWSYTYIDLTKVMDDPHIVHPIAKSIPKAYQKLVGPKSGTLVIWENFDRHTQNADEINHWIARTYRKFISENIVCAGKVIKNTGQVEIRLNSKPVEAWDPLYVLPHKDVDGGECATLFEEIAFDVPLPEDVKGKKRTSRVTIQMSFTPDAWRKEGGGKSGRSEIAKKLRLDDNEGFSIIRAGREVFYDEMPHFEPKVNADGLDRWWSAEIAFEPVLDKYFSVKNIKRGARLVKELREEIQERMKPTIMSCRRRVEEKWKETKKEHIQDGVDVSTHHTEAEKAVKAVAPSPGKAGQGKSSEEKREELKAILTPLVKTAVDLEAWRLKIESQPTTIVDNEGTKWKGSTFLDIHPQGGNTVIEYNMAHEFFLFVYSIVKELSLVDKKSDPELIVNSAKKLKTAIDLLFMAYAQAEGLQDPSHQETVGATLEFLKSNWGNYLKQFVKAYEADNATE